MLPSSWVCSPRTLLDEIAEVSMLVTQFSDIYPQVLIHGPEFPVPFLVFTCQGKAQAEPQDDNGSRQGGSDGASFRVKRAENVLENSWSGSVG